MNSRNIDIKNLQVTQQQKQWSSAHMFESSSFEHTSKEKKNEVKSLQE